jgi:hypothetical protein
MLCTILYVFFYKNHPDLKITLEAATTAVAEKFYKKIGFKCGITNNCTLESLHLLIYQHCIYYCSDDVKLIIYFNDSYITDIQRMINYIDIF